MHTESNKDREIQELRNEITQLKAELRIAKQHIKQQMDGNHDYLNVIKTLRAELKELKCAQ